MMRRLRLLTLLLVYCTGRFTAEAVLAVDFPDISLLRSQPELPDPLVMLDGTRITNQADWRSMRRPELQSLFQHYMYGFLPRKPERWMVETVLFSDPTFLENKATISESRLAFFGPDLKQRIHVLLVVPNHRTQPAPVFVGMNFCGNHALAKHPLIHIPESWVYKSCGGSENEHATEKGRGTQAEDWNLDLIIDRGYALAAFYSGDVDPDTADFSDGIEPAFYEPGQTSPKDDDPGAIAAWAWGYHRVLDFLIEQHSLAIDSRRIIAVGHSRNGKTALLAAAMDERIAIAIPHQAGCGGTAPSRGKVGEQVVRINTSFPHWFCDNFPRFNDQVDKLPFDQHCLVALCAPRPVLFTNAKEDEWANPDGQFEVLKAADPVYRLLKAGGLDADHQPEMRRLINSKLGYYLRPGNHSMNREDWTVFLDFSDHQLESPR